MILLNRKHLEAYAAMPETKMEGRFSFKKYKKDGMLVQDVSTVPNLITNAGLVMLGTGWAPAVFVGTGTSAPAFTDSTLQAYRAHTNTVQSNWNRRSAMSPVPGEWMEGTATWRFDVGTASGNLTEVGIGRIVNPSPFQYELFSRALIVDGSGSPISITVLADEYLDVTYTLRSHCSTADYETTFNISGVSYNLKIGRYNVGNNDDNGTYPMAATGIFSPNPQFGAYGHSGTLSFNGGITSDTPFNIGANQVLGGVATTTATPGGTSATAAIRFDLSQGNASGGIKGFTWLRSNRSSSYDGVHAGRYRATVTPAIPKDSTKILTFGLSWSWGRKV